MKRYLAKALKIVAAAAMLGNFALTSPVVYAHEETTEASVQSPLADDTPVPVDMGDGHDVDIQVVDASGRGVKGAEVTLNTAKATTDNYGIASFNNLTPGDYTVSYGNASKTIKVEHSQDATEVQSFTLRPNDRAATLASKGSRIALAVGTGLAVLALAGVAYYKLVYVRKRNQKMVLPDEQK